mmetsp:Transcript_10967/g.28134  ORF Transcript_10967/g.28134 Transcript_10967/m.28134 type:complete len:237 (+) Transcript_10967:608-1318(+)
MWRVLLVARVLRGRRHVVLVQDLPKQVLQLAGLPAHAGVRVHVQRALVRAELHGGNLPLEEPLALVLLLPGGLRGGVQRDIGGRLGQLQRGHLDVLEEDGGLEGVAGGGAALCLQRRPCREGLPRREDGDAEPGVRLQRAGRHARRSGQDGDALLQGVTLAIHDDPSRAQACLAGNRQHPVVQRERPPRVDLRQRKVQPVVQRWQLPACLLGGRRLARAREEDGERGVGATTAGGD